MCSQKMENYQGDLTDIIRATGSIIGGSDDSNTAPVAAEAATSSSSAVPEWQFPTNPINYTTDPAEDFGHPFSHLRDPLLHDIENPVSGFFNNSNNIIINPSVPDETAGSSAGGFANGSMKRPASNMFSRMLQISPNAKLPIPLCDSPAAVGSPRGLKGHPPMLISNHDHGLISPNSSKSCLVESPGLQISSPRNTGIKRRKSQAKKVVCIPAPAPVNSRPSGEVVPSDLWAWRKYGQKPIKGSPYPRGYYRCSSSKGCSARKQVERSRNDPNMLVITYTSEHNHPWPTQRNALAGSTRAPPSKNTTGASAKDSTSQNPKEEQKETSTENPTTPPSLAIDATVKEEKMDRDFDHNLENMDDPDRFERGFTNSYKPTLPDSNQTEDSFFADLGEIEADSLDMLFTQGFSGDDGREDKTLDPFTFYDWVGNNSTTSSAAVAASSSGAAAATTYEEATKKDSL